MRTKFAILLVIAGLMVVYAAGASGVGPTVGSSPNPDTTRALMLGAKGLPPDPPNLRPPLQGMPPTGVEKGRLQRPAPDIEWVDVVGGVREAPDAASTSTGAVNAPPPPPMSADGIPLDYIYLFDGGTDGNYIPWWGNFTSAMRVQYLYLASEIKKSGTITQAGLFKNYWAGYYNTFNNTSIKLCRTSLTSLTTNFQSNYGGNTPIWVYHGDLSRGLPTAGVYDSLDFTTPFVYNGTDNLIIEVLYSGTANSNGVPSWTAYGSGNRRAWLIDDTASNNASGVDFLANSCRLGFQAVANDVGVTAALAPSGVYTKGTTVYPEVKLCNFGTDAQTGFPVTVRIDAGGARVYDATETYGGTLAPGDTAHFALTTAFSVNYPFCRVTAFTNLSGDQDRADDTAFGTCLVADFIQDFETNDGGLQASPDTGGWAWGTPTGGNRPTAHSGTHVWGDVLSGYYHHTRDSLQMGPLKATVDNPVVGWWSSYQTWGLVDGYSLYYSTNNGSSWTMTHAEPGLGRGYDALLNYVDYDSAYCSYYGHSGWEQMFHKIPVPSGTPFMLMWMLRTYPYYYPHGDGVLIDDVAGFGCELLALDFVQNFETNDGNMQASPASGGWAWGTPSGGSRPAPHSGTHVWGDVLSGSEHGNARDSLQMGPLKATVDNPIVGWWSWYNDAWASDGYSLYYSTDNGSSWTMTHAAPGLGRGYDMTIAADGDSAYSGYHSGWEQMFHKIPVPSGTPFALMWIHRTWYYWYFYDGVLIDDVAGYGFRPAALDAGVVKILSPSGIIPLDPIAPKAVIRNYGTQSKPFNVTFSINCTPPYQKTVSVTVPPWSDDTVQFPNWTPTDGYFTARCQTFLTGDENPGNDWKTLDFSAVPCGWSARTNMPTLPSGKAEGAGGWLAYNKGDGLIYAAKGENTSDFYSYDLRTNTWTPLPPIPKGRENALPGDGCRGEADGQDNVYMTKGANTLGFWRYTISTQTWTQLTDVPAGKENVKGGTDLAYAKFGYEWNTIYLLKGQNCELYRYWADWDGWEQLPDAPTGGLHNWLAGSWLVSGVFYRLYASKAQTQEMYPSYDGGSDWNPSLIGMPLISRYENSKLPLGTGGCATWQGGADSAIYALKGNNTTQFWKYLPYGDSWTELDPMPQGNTPKRVHAGGDITSTADLLFALKGSKTNELWRYFPRPESSFLAREGVQATPAVLPLELALSVAPNPVRLGTSIHYAVPRATNVSLKLYNITGALAKTVSNGRVKPGRYTVALSAKGIARGVYILKLQSDAGNLTRKVVIE